MRAFAAAVLVSVLPLLACATTSSPAAPQATRPGASAAPSPDPQQALAAAPRRAAGDAIVVGVFELDAPATLDPAQRSALQQAYVNGLREKGLVVKTLAVASSDGAVPAGVDEAALEVAKREEGALPDVFVWPRASLEGELVVVRSEVLSAYGTGRATQRVLGAADGGREVAAGAAGTVGTFIVANLGPALPSRKAVQQIRRAEALRSATWLRESMPLASGRSSPIDRTCKPVDQ